MKIEIENNVKNHNHDRYIDTSEFNKLVNNNLITKTDFDAKLLGFNRKITKNKTNHLLVQNELNKLKTFDSSYFIVKNYFENDGTQNYLVFQPIDNYLKVNPKTGLFSEWKSKGLSDKIIKPPDNSLAPIPGFKNDGKRYFRFNGGCLKEDEAKSELDKIINIYIVYDLESNLKYNPDFTLENCLFGAVKITKNTDVDKYKYSGYCIGFDGRGVFTHPTGSFGNNAIIFGADMSSSVHIDNKGKDILILGKSPTQGLGENSLTPEKMYSINFSATEKKNCLSLH